MRAQINGPHKGPEPAITGKRHAILQGFEETDTIPFGGLLQPLRMEAGVEVLATYIPQFPVYPPEKAYMREPKTGIPGILLNEKKGQGRVIFVPADLDITVWPHQSARSWQPLKKHDPLGRKENIPLTAEGAGLGGLPFVPATKSFGAAHC